MDSKLVSTINKLPINNLYKNIISEINKSLDNV